MKVDYRTAEDPGDGDDLIQIQCAYCEADLTITKFANEFFTIKGKPSPTACQECIEKYDRKHQTKRMKQIWRRICPSEYQKTDIDHPGFNRMSYKEMQAHPMDENLLLVGPSQTSKTRCLFRRVRSAILAGMSVEVLYPEDLKELARSRFRKDQLVTWCLFDLIAIDDLFEIGSGEAVVDLVGDLLNRRIRDNKTTIITSMLTSSQVREEQQKFPNVTSAERARLEKLFYRIKENFKILHFEPQPMNREELPF
jgi:DNA replication protein DnaC